MSIRLSQDERHYLEQLAGRQMKPTRRQKAIALLRLGEGGPPEEVAQDAGIPKEDVAALASQFSEQGLAGVGLGEKSEIRVTLVRPGIGVQKYRLPKGATIADLLRRAEATTTNQAICADGVQVEGTVTLRDGAVVMIIPQSRNPAVAEPRSRGTLARNYPLFPG
jgi:hypothetical protein